MPEDAALGHVVLSLSVTDADMAAHAPSWLLSGSDAASAHFALSDRGELLVTRPLDRERQDRFELRAVASDGRFQASGLIDLIDLAYFLIYWVGNQLLNISMTPINVSNQRM